MTRRLPPIVLIDTDKRTITAHRGPVEPGSFVLCPPLSVPLIQPDNRLGTCAQCGKGIQFRPGHPPGLVRICTDCGILIAVTEGETRQ